MRIDELRSGSIIDLDHKPYQVLKSDFMKKAQRRPVMRTKLRNLMDGSVLEKTFKQGDNVQAADIQRSQAQFLYKEGDQFNFMDKESYEQFAINTSILGEAVKYLSEGVSMSVLRFVGKPINIELPNKISLKVIEAPPGVKGDTATGANKEVVLENGLRINVPLFINKGDVISINTVTGKYSERAKQA